MQRPDALFLLVKSLTAAEKALVRQSDKAQAGYLALFDLISKQKAYDERKTKKKLIQAGFEINFSYAKNYLTKHILKVLRENEDLGANASGRLVQEVEILMRRKVFDLAEKMLVKGKDKVWAEERWYEYLQLSTIELDLILQGDSKLENGLASIGAVNAKRKMARENLTNLGEFEDVYYSYRPVLKRKQSARNDWDLELVKEFGASPLLKSPDAAKTERARRMYYLCLASIHAYSGKYAEAKQVLSDAVLQYQNHAYLAEDFPEGYLSALIRLGGMQLHFGEYAAVEQSLAEIKAFQLKRGAHASEIFDKYNRLLVGYAVTTGKHAVVNDELSTIEAGLKQYADILPWASQSTLLFLVGRLLFDQARYKEAKDWLNQILDRPNRGIREDLTSLSRILQVLIYFESGESEMVDFASKATRKYLQRRDSLHQFERTMLKFMESNSFLSEGAALKAAFKQLHHDLQAVFEDPLEANVLAYFDIQTWLQTKLK